MLENTGQAVKQVNRAFANAKKIISSFKNLSS